MILLDTNVPNDELSYVAKSTESKILHLVLAGSAKPATGVRCTQIREYNFNCQTEQLEALIHMINVS
jgi:hypothetical protein